MADETSDARQVRHAEDQVAMVRLESKVDAVQATLKSEVHALNLKLDALTERFIQAISYGDRENSARIDAATARIDHFERDVGHKFDLIAKDRADDAARIDANRKWLVATVLAVFGLLLTIVGWFITYLIAH
jgi:hypothetical protein